MKPPKKRKKKKGPKSSSPSLSSLNPVMAEKKKRFPGLSLPDNAEQVKGLLHPDEREGADKDPRDVKVASEALNEVSEFQQCPDSI